MIKSSFFFVKSFYDITFLYNFTVLYGTISYLSFC